MPRTPDRRHGPLYEEEIFLDPQTEDPTQERSIRYVNGYFKGKDSEGVFDFRGGGSGGITEGQHELLDTLVHNLSETCYQEILRSAGKVSQVIVWTDDGKTTKVRQMDLTRSGGKVSQITLIQYDGGGSVKQTLVGSLNRTDGKVTSIDWVET